MKAITYDETVAFQRVFMRHGSFSPFENAQWHPYFVLATLGEVGTLVNDYCKQQRSRNNYSASMVNDCADIFIFLLLGALTYEQESGIDQLAKVRDGWSTPAQKMEDAEQLLQCFVSLNQRLTNMLTSKPAAAYHEEQLAGVFESVKSLSGYFSTDWQAVINQFHIDTLKEFTNNTAYGSDRLYKGRCFVDFGLLLAWVQRNEVRLPVQQMQFLSQMQGVTSGN